MLADSLVRTGYFADASASEYLRIDGYAVVNASLGCRTDRLELVTFARNLFNRNYMQNLTVQTGNSGLIVGTPGDPRIIGVTLRLRN